MRRREFIRLIGGAAAGYPFIAHAQQTARPVVGFLHGGFAAGFAEQATAFRTGLRKGGFVEGQNVAIEYRWAEGRFGDLPSLADGLVKHGVAVIAAIGGDIVAKAAMSATNTIPIVFMVGQDVIRSGLVTSLNRPGANATGVTLFVPDLVPKQMEIIHQIVPRASVIAVLENPNNPTVLPDRSDLEKDARANGLELQLLDVRNPQDIDTALAAAAGQRIDALLVSGDVSIAGRRDQILAATTRHRLPAIYPFHEYVQSGGLVSYGNDLNETAHLAGSFVARILAGEKPANLPVQQPTTFDLAINLKTAKTLGLSIPQALLVAADEVVE
jgi:putative tryptophan/tyrosine transport system substrate-binding protein